MSSRASPREQSEEQWGNSSHNPEGGGSVEDMHYMVTVGRGRALGHTAILLSRIVANHGKGDANSRRLSSAVLWAPHKGDTPRWENVRSHSRPVGLVVTDVLEASAVDRAWKSIHRVVMPLVQDVSYWHKSASSRDRWGNGLTVEFEAPYGSSNGRPGHRMTGKERLILTSQESSW